MPPPVAEELDSFQTISELILSPFTSSLVPPHDKTYGLEDGKSACTFPSVSLSREPWSPAAAQTVTPNKEAALKASLKLVRDCSVQFFSAEPQLMDITV